MTITSYATDEVAAQGTHFSLVLDDTVSSILVRLGQHVGVHVYAPGARGLLVKVPRYPTSGTPDT